jgi:HAD superfamily hydrolase (TIGR01509 family)
MTNLDLPLQAVIFDLDGLVLDSERCYFRCWKQAVEELGYKLDEVQYGDLIGIPTDRAETMLAELIGQSFSKAKFRRLWREHWDRLLEQEGIPEKPGFAELIELLETQRIPCAIASSSFQADVDRCLDHRRRHFSVILTRDQVQHGKPYPDLFLAAARQLAALPHHCLVLEDSEAGLQAALAAAMPVILVPDMKTPSPAAVSTAWKVCSSLHEVRTLLSAMICKLG